MFYHPDNSSMYVSQHVCLRLCLPLYQVAHPARISQYPLYMYKVTRSIVTPPDGILIHCKSLFSISLGSTSLLGTHDWILSPPSFFFSLKDFQEVLEYPHKPPTTPQPPSPSNLIFPIYNLPVILGSREALGLVKAHTQSSDRIGQRKPFTSF